MRSFELFKYCIIHTYGIKKYDNYAYKINVNAIYIFFKQNYAYILICPFQLSLLIIVNKRKVQTK